jgi:hypothetical protein
MRTFRGVSVTEYIISITHAIGRHGQPEDRAHRVLQDDHPSMHRRHIINNTLSHFSCLITLEN